MHQRTARPNGAWGAALLVILAAGCRQTETAPATPRYNVLLISIDSLRSDGLSCYGNPRATSPHIDALAARGVLFDRVIAAAPWTLASHASLLTGLYPNEHGVTEKLSTLDPRAPLLAEAFKTAGYRTGAIVSGPFMAKEYGLACGFEDYDDSIARMDENESHRAVTSPRLADKAIRWVRANAWRDGKPFFLFLHLWDVHYDYIPPPPYDRVFDPDYRGTVDGRFKPWYADFGPPRGLAMPPRDRQHVRALYDGEIAFTDEHLGRVLAEMDQQGATPRTIICVTADHGDEFYEHGLAGHQRTLYDEVLRVPWIVAGPGVGGPRRVAMPVSNVDILPTLMEAAGIRYRGAEISGRPVMTAAARPIFAETHYHWMKPACKDAGNEGVMASVESEGWKLMQRRSEPRFERLFDLRGDPGERLDVLSANGERAAKLRGLLQAQYAKPPRFAPGVMREKSVTDRLRGLGYIAGGDDGPAEAGPSTRPSSAASRPPGAASRASSNHTTTTPAGR